MDEGRENHGRSGQLNVTGDLTADEKTPLSAAFFLYPLRKYDRRERAYSTAQQPEQCRAVAFQLFGAYAIDF